MDPGNEKRGDGKHCEENHVEVGHSHHELVLWLREKVVRARRAVLPRVRLIVRVARRGGRRQPDGGRRVRLVITQTPALPFVDPPEVTQRRPFDELHRRIRLLLEPVATHVDEDGRYAQHRQPHEREREELHEREVQHDADAVLVQVRRVQIQRALDLVLRIRLLRVLHRELDDGRLVVVLIVRVGVPVRPLVPVLVLPVPVVLAVVAVVGARAVAAVVAVSRVGRAVASVGGLGVHLVASPPRVPAARPAAVAVLGARVVAAVAPRHPATGSAPTVLAHGCAVTRSVSRTDPPSPARMREGTLGGECGRLVV